MKNILTDFKGEAALDLVANIIEPISVLAADETLKEMLSGDLDGAAVMKLVSYLLKNNKKEVLEILAATEGKKPEECDFTIKSIFVDVNNLVKMITEDPDMEDVRDFFSGLSQKGSETSSGNATEPTKETETK